MPVDLAKPYHTLSPDEVLDVIREKALQDGDDFRVKVGRKTSPTATLENVALLDGARAEHFTFPEQWLRPLLGAGPDFHLTAYHAKEPNRAVGVVKVVIQGQPRGLDVASMKDPAWKGPVALIDPDPARFERPSSFSRDSDPRSPENGPASPKNPALGGGDRGSYSSDPMREILRLEQEVGARQRALEMEQVKSSHKMELSRVEQQIAEMKREVSRPQGESLGSVVKEVMTGLLPLITQQMNASAERQMQFMRMMMEANKKDPAEGALVTRMVESQIAHAKEQITHAKEIAEIQKINAEANAAQNRSTLQMVASVMEMGLQGKGDDDSMTGVIRDLLQFLSKSQSNKVNRPGPVQQQALPPVQAPQGFNGQAQPAPVPIQLVQPAQPTKQPTIMDRIEASIRSFVSPEDVARYFFSNIESHEIDAELKKANDSITELFSARLLPWVTEGTAQEQSRKASYLKTLVDVTMKMGDELGVFGPDEEAPAQEEDAN